MIKHIRQATVEEIEKIRDKSDLMPGHTQILAMDSDSGGADIAVVRNCFEINPIIFGEGVSDRRKLLFLHLLEERMLGAGVDRYYSQVPAADTHYKAVLEKLGFEQISPTPEYRILKVIR